MRFNPLKKMQDHRTTGPQDHRQSNPGSPVVSSPVVPCGLLVTIKPAVHTKRQCPIWIAQLNQRVDKKEFLRLCGTARAGDGYYSSFGPPEIHGFIFFDETKASAFAALAALVGPVGDVGPVGPVGPPVPEPEPEPEPQNIVQLPNQMPAWRQRLMRQTTQDSIEN